MRRRRITFNELVENVEDSTTSPLKFSPEVPTAPPIPGVAMAGNPNGEAQSAEAKWNFPSSTVRNPNPGRLFESAKVRNIY